MDLKAAEKQEIWPRSISRPLDRVLALLGRRIEVLKVSRQIDERTREAFDERQKEAVLRERLRQIQKELGETDTRRAEIDEMKQAIKDAGMPPEVASRPSASSSVLERMPDSSAEYSMTEPTSTGCWPCPGRKSIPRRSTSSRRGKILDQDIMGSRSQRRILEFLAVRKLNPRAAAPFSASSAPRAWARPPRSEHCQGDRLKFGRVSLGGVHDEAEIRGHRRTYIDRCPATLCKLCASRPPQSVLMLDEVDKLSASHQGDPFSALLEVLDPEQNNTFATTTLPYPSTCLGTVHRHGQRVGCHTAAAARPHEIIELTGYTEEEKLQIAKRYLLTRQLTANGLNASQVDVSEEALRRVIVDYTREAGVRSLERQIGALLRNAAVTIARPPASIGRRRRPTHLGCSAAFERRRCAPAARASHAIGACSAAAIVTAAFRRSAPICRSRLLTPASRV